MKKSMMKVGDVLGVKVGKQVSLVRVTDLASPPKKPAMFSAAVLRGEAGRFMEVVPVHPGCVFLNLGNLSDASPNIDMVWEDVKPRIIKAWASKASKPAAPQPKAVVPPQPTPDTKPAPDFDQQHFADKLKMESLSHKLVCAHFNSIAREMQIAFAKNERLSLDEVIASFQGAITDYNTVRGF